MKDLVVYRNEAATVEKTVECVVSQARLESLRLPPSVLEAWNHRTDTSVSGCEENSSTARLVWCSASCRYQIANDDGVLRHFLEFGRYFRLWPHVAIMRTWLLLASGS
jgi:hypothetical protein